MMPTDLFSSYVAGIVDGEGHLAIVKHYDKRQKKDYYYPYIRVGNTNFILLNQLHEKTGFGSINSQGIRKSPKHKKCLYWTVGRYLEIEQLLKKILPYLIIKTQQAKLLLAFLKIYKSQKRNVLNGIEWKGAGSLRGRPTWAIYNPEQIEIYNSLRKLNKKGAS